MNIAEYTQRHSEAGELTARKASDATATQASKWAHKAAVKHRVSIVDMFAPTRVSARVVAARHDAWSYAREAGWSLPRIGRAFNRHHTTILDGLRKHAENEK